MAEQSQARFTMHFTEAQKTAILRSVLVDGRSVAETIRMAKTGRLGMPAFDIGRYAYQLVRKNRESFEAREPEALTAAIDHELKGAELDILANLRAIRRPFKRDGTDNVEALKRAALALSALRKARREAQTTTKTKPRAEANPSAEPNASVNTDVIGTLLSKTPRRAFKPGDDPVRSSAH
jgi:hypothetical protein